MALELVSKESQNDYRLGRVLRTKTSRIKFRVDTGHFNRKGDGAMQKEIAQK
jgi:hypothetical protein